MKYLILMLLAPMSVFAASYDVRIDITPPTLYDNGDPFTVEMIDRYEICVSAELDTECEQIVETVEASVVLPQIIEDASHKYFKGRVIDLESNRGHWSEAIKKLVRSPGASSITVKIIIIINGEV